MVFVLIFTFVSMTAFAAGREVAAVGGSSSSVDFSMSVDYAKVTLTVSGPDGSIWTREFAAGSAPSIRLADLSKMGNGTYQYELSVSPRVSADVSTKLRAARDAGDDQAAAKIQREAGLDRSFSQSGSFIVVNGAIVSSGAKEGGVGVSKTPQTGNAAGAGWQQVVNDQVIPDDLIVQGSACVGLDCVNNESFGFDTIRLKENNTRIKFDDTSSSAGFPANDWQLTANDSASGGSSKFSIEDITGSRVPFTVTAGATTNSIFVDSSGRVGFRTSTPVLDLHVNTSNTPALRLEQNNTGGFTAQTWDVAGNEANFFVRDVTGGSKLSFRIRPGAPTSSVDISSDGDVGIGTASPQKKLHVLSTAVTTFPSAALGSADLFVIENNGNTNMAFVAADAGNQSNIRFVRSAATAQNGAITYLHASDALTFTTASSERFRIASNGFVGIGTTTTTLPLQVGTNGTNGNGANLTTGGVWTNGSSRTFKENIHELTADEAKAAVAALKPVTYEYKNDPQKEPYVGFIAEDVPELVAQQYDHRYLSPMDIVATLTKVVQDQQQTIDKLNERLDQLEKNNNQ
ncbi:MAG TPA: tail fiber domain-containing protein [Thermoanaerobaculia bacterium]|nr:tail fiber domain-containing protein [Thermoanaerobaculia bacterium]